jgi:hypothetical protein
MEIPQDLYSFGGHGNNNSYSNINVESKKLNIS